MVLQSSVTAATLARKVALLVTGTSIELAAHPIFGPVECFHLEPQPLEHNILALIITYTILGVPYYDYSILGPQNSILIIKAPILRMHRARS